MLTLDTYSLSDIGLKRTNNEDAVGMHEPKETRQLRQSGCLYVVADGLGGHQFGEKASNYAVETLLKVYYEAPRIPPEKRLREIIQQINQNLISFARKNMLEGEKIATTVVSAVVRNNTLLVANVGDSRAYLIRDGRIRQITTDHSFVGELVRAGTITEVEAQQSKFKNRLTRSVGSDSNLEVELYPPIALRPGDTILLCTDGLTQYATAQNLLEAASVGKAREIVERLIRFAKAHGGSDNITVLVSKVGKNSISRQTKALKTITAILLGLLMLAIFSLIGLNWFNRRTVSIAETSTLTVSPARTATLTPTPTFTSTPTMTPTETTTLEAEPTQSATPTASETASASPTPTTSLVNCEVIVQPGEYAKIIADKFQAAIEQVFRQNDSQENMDQINPGEILIVKNISPEACTNGGGIVQIQPSPATP